MCENPLAGCEVSSIVDEFVPMFRPLLTKQVDVKKAFHTLYDDNHNALYCSYIGAIYEDVDLNLAIADFAKEVAEIWNKYTVVAQLAPEMRMWLIPTGDCQNRYMLLQYVFIREFPQGAFGYSDSPLFFDASRGNLPETRTI